MNRVQIPYNPFGLESPHMSSQSFEDSCIFPDPFSHQLFDLLMVENCEMVGGMAEETIGFIEYPNVLELRILKRRQQRKIQLDEDRQLVENKQLFHLRLQAYLDELQKEFKFWCTLHSFNRDWSKQKELPKPYSQKIIKKFLSRSFNEKHIRLLDYDSWSKICNLVRTTLLKRITGDQFKDLLKLLKSDQFSHGLCNSEDSSCEFEETQKITELQTQLEWMIDILYQYYNISMPVIHNGCVYRRSSVVTNCLNPSKCHECSIPICNETTIEIGIQCRNPNGYLVPGKEIAYCFPCMRKQTTFDGPFNFM